MHVNLLGLKSEKQYVMAVIRMVDGQMQIEGALSPRRLAHLEFEHQHWSEKGLDDETFLRKLPHLVSGTYVRAQFVAKD